MGRSRAVPRFAEEDANQRSKRKKTVSSLESAQITPTNVCQEISEEKAALYHCNYCKKNISGKIRIKCAVCPDFDLCVECFSVGAEVTPHKSSHSYKVMDNLSFPLICPDWNADEEILLLEGIEMYGFGNWNEVAEHVGTKSKSRCIDHYNAIYVNSPCFPLPDMSHVVGKSRDELLAMAKGYSEIKKEFPAVGDLTIKEESALSARVKSESHEKQNIACQSLSGIKTEFGSCMSSSSGNNVSDSVKKASNKVQINDSKKVEESQVDRSIGEKKLRISEDKQPSLAELSGYNFKRQEFELEYDNDAEQLLADMEFKDTDTAAEHDLKLRVLHIYFKRLGERKRRKDFIVERNLLYPDPFEVNLSPEEREIYHRYKVFMRFLSKEEHEELMKSVIEEYRIVKRIHDLQEARAAGCRTSGELNKFFEDKQKKEADENAQRVKESLLAGPSAKVLQRHTSLKEVDGSLHEVVRGSTVLHTSGKDSSSTFTNQISCSLDRWDISGFLGTELLSESEKQLCCEMRILPTHYLNMLQIMSVGIMKGTVTKKSDAHSLFKVDTDKVDKVYDMLVKKGMAPA
ncbi:transcriptional adapter ADA2-like isoform X2 [Mercurialis annua]|uniref:transcriptional adapter ADA2-like isoform X2 n=1 Tax=Mercurialis annua TaxID=3986 RepID=UPI00215E0963|nr:transcriptional adapter ADA2-like isoform X2 [Mercurialis annua]